MRTRFAQAIQLSEAQAREEAAMRARQEDQARVLRAMELSEEQVGAAADVQFWCACAHSSTLQQWCSNAGPYFCRHSVVAWLVGSRWRQ